MFTTFAGEKMDTLGHHLIADFFGCDQELLDSHDLLEMHLEEAVVAMGASIVGRASKRFSPSGVTIVLALSESHISIHTWPENSYAAIDIFTCGKIEPNVALQILVSKLKPRNLNTKKLTRGFPEKILIR